MEVYLTDLERAVLGAVINSQYHNGASGADIVGNHVWSQELADEDEVRGLTRHQIAGCLSSLDRKGLVECSGNTGRDATVAPTKAGVDMWALLTA